MTTFQTTDDLFDAMYDEIVNTPGIYMLVGLRARYIALGDGVPLEEDGRVPDSEYLESKSAELIDDLLFNGNLEIPAASTVPRITIDELNGILSRPDTKVEVSWGVPDHKARVGCYITAQVGLVSRSFFVGMDTQSGESIVEVLA